MGKGSTKHRYSKIFRFHLFINIFFDIKKLKLHMGRAGLGNMGHKLYIFKIVKQIHGKNAISQPPDAIVNNFVNN